MIARSIQLCFAILYGSSNNYDYYATDPYYTYLFGFQNGRSYSCGATLIHDDIILSAAHCVGSSITAYTGASSFDDNNVQGRRVVAGNVFPGYNSVTLENDIMVLKLEAPIEGIAPVRLNSNGGSPSDGNAVSVFGFGVTSPDGSTSTNVLLETELNAVPFDTCNAQYGFQLNSAVHLCAAAPGRDSCQGDSGGAWVV